MAQALFIGVDGGGTNCRARIRDEAGELLGEGSGGPANARLGERAFAAVLSACRAAAEAAGLGEGDLARAHAGLGLAGVAQPVDRDFILAQPHPFASLVLDTDAYVAWLGAFEGADGAILILGTGSCGLAVVGGKRFNVSGWGDQNLGRGERHGDRPDGNPPLDLGARGNGAADALRRGGARQISTAGRMPR